MASPELVEDIEIRPGRGHLFAYIDGKLLGKVSSLKDGVHVKLIGRKFRAHKDNFDATASALNSVAAAIYLLAAAHEPKDKPETEE